MTKRYPFIQNEFFENHSEREREGACLIEASTSLVLVLFSPTAGFMKKEGFYETFPPLSSASSSASSEGKPMPLIRQNKTKLAKP